MMVDADINKSSCNVVFVINPSIASVTPANLVYANTASAHTSEVYHSDITTLFLTEIVEYNKFFRGVYTTLTRHVRRTATIVMFPSAYDVSRVLNTKPTLL